MNFAQLEHACKALSAQGWKLKLDQAKIDSNEVWLWTWKHTSGFAHQGWTDAAPKPVAFTYAVQAGMETVVV